MDVPATRHVCPRTKHAGVTRIGIIIWPSLPLVVGVAAVAFNAVYKAAKRATNSEAVVPGEEAPYRSRLRIVAWDRKKIHMRVAGTNCPKGIILRRHCRLRSLQVDCRKHSHAMVGCQWTDRQESKLIVFPSLLHF